MLSSRGALRDLDIGPDPRLASVELTGISTGAVVAGSLVALDGSVSQQRGRDVMQSMLLAQLAANVKASRFREPSSWYKAYQSTLESIGWVVSGSTSFSQYISPVSRFTIADVIRDCFRLRTTAAELSLINRTVAAFTSDPGAPSQFIWECPSHSGGLGNFQFGLAAEEEDALTLQLGRFVLETPQHVVRLAFQEFGREAKFTTSHVSMTLNEDFFSRLRSEIESKLEGRYEVSVSPIELLA